MSGTVEKLVVTLTRGLAGKRKYHKDVLKALGLSRRLDVTVLPNESSFRGALYKVRHLVRVETDADFAARQKEFCESRALRDPVSLKH